MLAFLMRLEECKSGTHALDHEMCFCDIFLFNDCFIFIFTRDFYMALYLLVIHVTSRQLQLETIQIDFL